MSETRESYRGFTVPTKATLAKYGLDYAAWRAIVNRQGGVCPVCQKVPTTGRGVIDHEHVRGWKNLPPELRSVYVRGVCCWFCNHAYLGRGITTSKAYNAWVYLRDYDVRRADS